VPATRPGRGSTATADRAGRSPRCRRRRSCGRCPMTRTDHRDQSASPAAGGCAGRGRNVIFGGVPVVVQGFRSLGLPGSVRREVRIKVRRRGYAEATFVETFVVLNAVGGECLDDFDCSTRFPTRPCLRRRRRRTPDQPVAKVQREHRDRRGARLARRDDRAYREYLRQEQSASAKAPARPCRSPSPGDGRHRQARGPQRGNRVGVEEGCVAGRM
jgi:hypothetical protein